VTKPLPGRTSEGVLPLVARYSALVIAGPTGVGKSEVALDAARRLGGEIVGADAFQVYRGLDLLTAQPSREAQAEIPHHLIGEIPLTAEFDVGQYLLLAGERLKAIRARGKLPIVVGGTGLYIRALLRGLADLPPADPALRAELSAQPLADLQRRLAELDPKGYADLDRQNPRRVIRALEVCLLSGRPFSSFRIEWNASPIRECGIVLMRERQDLYTRIDRRVDEMFDAGVAEEVQRAGTTLSATASQALGWREIRQMLDGQLNREACVAAIQQATRQYAKRQLTWFRKEAGLKPVDAGLAAAAIDALVAPPSLATSRLEARTTMPDREAP
jgi:tRNA dimethylallyltransferase